jgi:hypothetical protein
MGRSQPDAPSPAGPGTVGARRIAPILRTAACFAAGFLLAAAWRTHAPSGSAPEPAAPGEREPAVGRDPARAELEYRGAIAADPYSSEAHYMLGRLLVSRGREEEARPHLERHRRLRSLESEVERLEELLEEAPDRTSILLELSRVRRLLGRGGREPGDIEPAPPAH